MTTRPGLLVSTLLLLLLNQIACHQADKISPTQVPLWQLVPTSPNNTFRIEAASFAIGAETYFGLGLGGTSNVYGGSTYFNDFWAFNTTTSTWRRITDLPGGGRSGATAFAINGRGYVAGGYSTRSPGPDGLDEFVFYHDIWEYTPASNSWRQVATLNELVYTRYGLAMVINEKAYLLINNECVEFDPRTSVVTKKKPFYSAEGGGGFVIDKTGYVFLGQPDQLNRSVYAYNSLTDTWTQKKDFPGEPRVVPTGFSLNGYGYCAGGQRSGLKYTYFKEVWRYAPLTDTWTRQEDYPGKGSSWLCSSVTGNQVLMGSGQGLQGEYLRLANDFWQYQPR